MAALVQQSYNSLKSVEDAADPKPWLVSLVVFNETVTQAKRSSKKSTKKVLARFRKHPTIIEQYFKLTQQGQNPAPSTQPQDVEMEEQAFSSPTLGDLLSEDEEMESPLAAAAAFDHPVDEEEREMSAPPGKVAEWVDTPDGPVKVYFDEDWVEKSVARERDERRLNHEINEDRKRARAEKGDDGEPEYPEAVQRADTPDEEAFEYEDLQYEEEHGPVQDFLDHMLEGLQFEDGQDPVQVVHDELLQGKTPDELMEKYGSRLDVPTRKQMEYDAYFAAAYARTVWSRGELLPIDQYQYTRRTVLAFISLPPLPPAPFIPHPSPSAHDNNDDDNNQALSPQQLEFNALASHHMLRTARSRNIPLPASHEARYLACIRDFDAYTDAHPFYVGNGGLELDMAKLEMDADVSERTFAAARGANFILSRENFEMNMMDIRIWDVLAEKGDLLDEKGRKVLRWDPTFSIWLEEDEGVGAGVVSDGDGNGGVDGGGTNIGADFGADLGADFGVDLGADWGAYGGAGWGAVGGAVDGDADGGGE